MTMKIYSWNYNSEGAKELADALDIRRIRHEGSTFRGSQDKIVINWGAGTLPREVLKCKIINNTKAVNICSNKLSFFQHVSGKGVSVPDWTEDSQVAIRWVAEGHDVCARKILNGHSGAGLEIMDRNKPKSLVKAPLYVKYIPKKDEYRIHVINGQVTTIQRKALRPNYVEEHGQPNWKVRNLDNGFIYVRGDVRPPRQVLDQAIMAIRVCGLDFGAVDIVFNDRSSTAYVLEINSAPGLTGETINEYAEALRR